MKIVSIGDNVQEMSKPVFLDFYLSQETGFDISCKFSPLEKICMKFQVLCSGKKQEKYFKILSAEIFTRSAHYNQR